MAIAENRALLGVEKTKLPTKRTKKTVKKKLFVTKVVDYLNSDSYLFAPLITNVNSKEEKIESEIKLVKQFLDYLMSDNYMYALIVAPLKPIFFAPKEPQPQIKRVTAVEVSRTSITLTDKSPLANRTSKAGHAAKDYLPENVAKDRQPQVPKETLDNAIYGQYRPTPAPKECLARRQ